MNAFKKRLGSFTPLAGVAGLLVIWQIAVLVEVVDPVLLPTPAETFAAVWHGMVGGDIEAFHRIVLETDQRLGTGSALGDTLHCAPSD